MQKRVESTPRTPREQVVRSRPVATESAQRRTVRGRGRGAGIPVVRRQPLPLEPTVAEGVSPYLYHFKELHTPATEPPRVAPAVTSPPPSTPLLSTPAGVVVGPLPALQFPQRHPNHTTRSINIFAPKGTPASSDPDDADVDLQPPKRVAWVNVHTLLLAIIALPTILGIILCTVYLATASEVSSLHSNKQSSAIPNQALPSLLALEEELSSAAAFMSVVAGRNVTRTSAYRNQAAGIQKRFLIATTATDAAISQLLRDYGRHVSVYNAQGLDFNINGIDASSLDRSRRGVSAGVSPSLVFRTYRSVVQSLVVFVARTQIHAAAVDYRSLEVLGRMFAAGQWASASSLSTFLAFKRSTAPPSRLFRNLQDYSELAIPWLAAAEMDVFEVFLRYPTSSDFLGAESYVSTSGRVVLPDAVLPSGELVSQLYQQSLQVEPAWAWLPNVSFSADEAAMAGRDLTSTLASFRASIAGDIERASETRPLLQVVVVSILLVVCVVTIIAGIVNAVLYLQASSEHATLNATVLQLNSSMNRMCAFVTSLMQLDTPLLQQYQRWSVQRGAPVEEASLYKAVAPVRDFESYLPVTVRHPPHGLPKEALGSKSGLFLRPALIHGHGYVALRLGLSEYHSAFSTNGPKQKLVHNVLSRTLSTLQELGDLACGVDETNTAASPFISLYGDHVVLWLNVSRPISHPCLRAILIAKLLAYETCKWHGFDRNMLPISLCAGDAVLGHVGNQLPMATASKTTPLVSFAALGPLPEDLTLANHIIRLHQSNFLLNNAAVQGYFRERAEMGDSGDSAGRQTFHNVLAYDRLSVLAHLLDSGFLLSKTYPTGYSHACLRRILQNVYVHASNVANGGDPEPWVDVRPGDHRDVMTVLAPALADLISAVPRGRKDKESLGAGNKRGGDAQEGSNPTFQSNLRYVSSISLVEFEALLRGLQLHFTPVELLEVPLYNSADSGSGEYLPQPDQVLPGGQRFIDFSGVKAQTKADQTKTIVFPCFVQGPLSEREEALVAARVLQPYFREVVAAALASGFVPAHPDDASQNSDSSDEDGQHPERGGEQKGIGAKDVERLAALLPSPKELEATLREACEQTQVWADAEWEVLFRRYVQLSQQMQKAEAVALMNRLQEYGARRSLKMSATVRPDARLGGSRLHPSKATAADSSIHQQHISTTIPTVDRLVGLLSTGLELGAVPTSVTYLKKSRLLETL